MASDGDRLLEAIVQSSDDAIFSKTLDGTITSWNPAAERLYRYTAAEAIGANVKMLASDEAAESDVDDILHRVARGEQVARQSAERRTKDGRVIRVIISVSPLRDNEGTIVGASVITHEPTTTEREVAEMRQMVVVASAQAQEMRGMVSAAIAQAAQTEVMAKRIHDLKNVVTGVAGKLGSLKSSVDQLATTEDVDERLSTLEDKVETDQDRRISDLSTRVYRVIAVGLAIAVALAGSFVRLESTHSCEQRNHFRTELAAVVETSFGGQQIDPSLVPESLRPLIAESARRSAGLEKRLVDGLRKESEDCSVIPGL